MKSNKLRFIKIFLCIVLTFTYFFDAFCSLVSTDGSYFVTKAECDSAMADFNSRLTTFEAGINSKIDSQVTSYLDRNGIWSGKQQVAVDSYTISTSYFDSIWNLFDITRREIPCGNAIIVNNITKSGLAVIDYDYHAANYWNYMTYRNNMYQSGVDRFAYWYDAWYEFDLDVLTSDLP